MDDVPQSADAAFVIPLTVLRQGVGEEVVLLNLQTEQYYSLDPVAARIVADLTRLPYDDAVASLHAEFEVDRARLEADIATLVDELLGTGLLQRR